MGIGSGLRIEGGGPTLGEHLPGTGKMRLGEEGRMRPGAEGKPRLGSVGKLRLRGPGMGRSSLRRSTVDIEHPDLGDLGP